MKIIQVIPHLRPAGAEHMCVLLSELLAAQPETEVLVVSLYTEESLLTKQLRDRGIALLCLDKRPGPDWHIFWRLYKLFCRERPDIIHTHLYVPGYVVPAARLAGCRVLIHTVHSIADRETSRPLQSLMYLLYKWRWLLPVALSPEIAESLSVRYLLNTARIPLIANGIDLSRCRIKQEYQSQANGRLRFIHIGRFSKEKNHALLLRAFAAVKEQLECAELVLLGSGPLESELRELIREHGLEQSVSLPGFQAAVGDYLCGADVFVLPSAYEGLPLALMEAMACGLPVIASAVGGIPTLIQSEENGLLIRAEENELAAAMLRMQDEALRERLGRSARAAVLAEYSGERMAEAYLKLYRRQCVSERER